MFGFKNADAANQNTMPDGDPRAGDELDDGDSTDVPNVNDIGQQEPDADEEIEATPGTHTTPDATPVILSLSASFKNDVGSTGGSAAHPRVEMIAILDTHAVKKLSIAGPTTALEIAKNIVNVANW